MFYPSITPRRFIIVADEELSSFKGIQRICSSADNELLYFDHPNSLKEWFTKNQRLLTARSSASCLIFSPNFLQIFENQALNEWLLVCPKICISRSSNSEIILLTSKIVLFEFVGKPFRLEQMKAILERAFTFYQQGANVHNRFKNLTKREQQTCELLASGRPNKEIADLLGISIKTVKVHRANLMRKIEVKSIADLLRAYNSYQALSNNSNLLTLN